MDETSSLILLAILAGFSLTIDLCFTVFFLFIPQLREGPGQLILAQTQAQILLTLVWFFTIEDVGTINSQYVCTVVDFAMCATYFYLAAICIATSQRWEDYTNCTWQLMYHIAVLVPSIAISAYTGYLQDTNRPYSEHAACIVHSALVQYLELPLLLFSALISLSALLFSLYRFGHSRKFFWNTLLVSLTVVFLWLPHALYLFICAVTGYEYLNYWGYYGSSLPVACAPIVVMLIRLSYRPVRLAIKDRVMLNRRRADTSLRQIILPNN